MSKIILCLACVFLLRVAQAQEGPDKNINAYLVDITGGAVTAMNLVGGGKSPITQIETSQDLVLALQPFTSGSDQKSAFGIAITPAKTTLFPMAGRTYVSSDVWRLLGNLTLSYAQNPGDIAGQSYKRTAFSVDTVYYIHLAQDPVYAASDAFKACADKEVDKAKLELIKKRVEQGMTDEAFQKGLEDITNGRDLVLTACIDDSLKSLAKAQWNAGRISVSYGEGRIKAASDGSSNSLGKSFNLNAQYPVGKGVLAASLRHTREALDPSSVGKPSLVFKSSRLVAARFTYGDQGETDFRALAEVSNSKSSSADAFKDAFMYAAGIDKKLSKGAWLEFRLGRNRSIENGKEQTTALMSLNVSPTLFEFKK
jgi:hypothetical protein